MDLQLQGRTVTNRVRGGGGGPLPAFASQCLVKGEHFQLSACQRERRCAAFRR